MTGNVQEGISYVDDARVFDIYFPEQVESPVPVVVLVTGYPDPEFEEAGRHEADAGAGL